jgi:ribosomal protein S13
LAELFDQDDVVVNRTRVAVVLRAVPGFGPAKVAALMAVCGVGQRCRVGELEEGQRHRLLDAFAGQL